MRRVDSNSWLVVSIWSGVFFFVSWLLFGPIDGFHHDVSYGVFGYMLSGGEDADPGDFELFGTRYWFFPKRFVVTMVVWLPIAAVFLATLYSFVRPD
jgi:hypothetical protein